MKIGIDLDDVLIDFNTHLTYYHNEVYGTSHTKEDFTTWNLWEIWGTTEEESYKRIDDFINSPEHDTILPVLGAVEAIKHLKENHELILITARDSKFSNQAFKLINTFFENAFSSIHFLYDNGVKNGTKGGVSKKLGIDVFIDDSLANAENVASEGITSYLFDTPWNKDCRNEKIIRVHSWEDILKRLEIA